MIRAAVIDNGLSWIGACYPANAAIDFARLPARSAHASDLHQYDWVVVPNGSDHVALWRARAAVSSVLERGGVLTCGDGWFTDWVPGNRWIHDNSQPTALVRYRIRSDRHGLLRDIDLDDFNFRDGISGWWACGYIEAAPGAEVLLEDTWGRPVLVLDEHSTPGKMLLSASGPLAENHGGNAGIDRFWQRALQFLAGTRPLTAPSMIPELPAEDATQQLPNESASTIGLVFNGVWSHWAFATAPKYRPCYRLLYVHELDWAAISTLDALVIPFQSDLNVLLTLQPLFERFLDGGKKIAMFGDSGASWPGARWEHRPVDNAWWRKDPTRPPITATDRTHPLYGQLADRHCGWHCHGAFTSLPSAARVIQHNAAGEAITWEVQRGPGTLLVSTKDPIVEHGVQQIRHLDHYNDALTQWLCNTRPAGPFTVERRWYAVRNFRPSPAPNAA